MRVADGSGRQDRPGGADRSAVRPGGEGTPDTSQREDRGGVGEVPSGYRLLLQFGPESRLIQVFEEPEQLQPIPPKEGIAVVRRRLDHGDAERLRSEMGRELFELYEDV